MWKRCARLDKLDKCPFLCGLEGAAKKTCSFPPGSHLIYFSTHNPWPWVSIVYRVEGTVFHILYLLP